MLNLHAKNLSCVLEKTRVSSACSQRSIPLLESNRAIVSLVTVFVMFFPKSLHHQHGSVADMSHSVSIPPDVFRFLYVVMQIKVKIEKH
jgi:hypothetical protein